MSRDFALVFAANDEYARGVAVAVSSACAHLSPAVAPEIYILDEGMTAASRVRLERVIARAGASDAVRWVALPADAFRGRGGTAVRSSPTYLRLLIPELLPARISRAVYLDADVLVRGAITPLFTVDLDGAPLGAVQDYAIATTAHAWSGLRGEDRSRAYLNAGVLVMDLERCRATDLSGRALRYVERLGARPSWDDQGVLNAVVDQWHLLDLTWNVQLLNLAVVERLPETELTPHLVAHRRRLVQCGAVLHFIGPKPWSSRSTVPGTGAWVVAFLRSGWYSPVRGALWLAPWLAVRTPRRVWWSVKRQLVRALDAHPVRRVIGRYGAPAPDRLHP